VFLPFFETLRRAGVPVSLREYLAFLEGMAAGLATYDAEGFYFLARRRRLICPQAGWRGWPKNT